MGWSIPLVKWESTQNCVYLFMYLLAETLAKSHHYFCQSNGWRTASSLPDLPLEGLLLGAALCGLWSCPWSFCRWKCHGVIRPRHFSKPWRTPALFFGILLHGHLVLVLLSGWFHQASHVSPHHSFSPEVEKDKKKHLIAKKLLLWETKSPLSEAFVFM